MAFKSKYNNPMAGRWCKLYRGTPAELSLEDAVAALGIPYRTQFPGFMYGIRYFPDFVLPTLQVVIEVDDSSHRRKAKREQDAERTQNLKEKFDWTVVRCTNEEALKDPFGAVERMLTDIGYYPIDMGIRSLRVADFLPNDEDMSRADKREAKSRARARKRGTID